VEAAPEMFEPELFFDLEGHPFAELFAGARDVWRGLDRLESYLADTLAPNVAALRRGGDVVARTTAIWQGEAFDDGLEIVQGDVKRGGLVVRRAGRVLDGAAVVQAGAILASADVQIGPGTLVEAGALVRGPTILGARTEVRHGAYVRGDCLVGDGCVVGHATEMKSSIMMGGSQAGHFAYVGDSILGRVNLGAGTKLANLKVFPGTVSVKVGGVGHDTGRRKLGAILADGVELGCNSVTTPGTVLGRGVVVYPNVTVRGYHGPGAMLKGHGEAETRDGGRP
jgi:hypothetical protein